MDAWNETELKLKLTQLLKIINFLERTSERIENLNGLVQVTRFLLF